VTTQGRRLRRRAAASRQTFEQYRLPWLLVGELLWCDAVLRGDGARPRNPCEHSRAGDRAHCSTDHCRSTAQAFL